MVFLCCLSSDRSSKAEADTRHARLVAVTASASTFRRHSSGLYESPPAYHDIVHQPPLSIDEKEPLQFQCNVETNDDPPPPVSPRSSIVSIPTCVAGLTNSDTGSTRHASRRESLDRVSTRASLPPSYYSRRSPSPALLTDVQRRPGETDSILGHPVMSSSWLEVIRQEQEREHASMTPLDRLVAAVPPGWDYRTNRPRGDRQQAEHLRLITLQPQTADFQPSLDQTP
jgi:hypothetical protein